MPPFVTSILFPDVGYSELALLRWRPWAEVRYNGLEGNADDVLIQAGEAYRSFESYSDVGHMETIWHAGTDKERLSKLTFSTYFKRPNLLRFEWCNYSNDARLPDRVNVICSDGKHFYTKYSYDDKANRKRDLSLMVAGATGVSSGTAHTIPALLTEQIGGRKLTNITAPGYVGSEVVDDEQENWRCLLDLGKAAHVTDFFDSWSRLLRVLLIALCA